MTKALRPNGLTVFKANGCPPLTTEQQQHLDSVIAQDMERRAFLEALPDILIELERFKFEAISFIFSVPAAGVLEYHMSVLRRYAIATAAISAPAAYVGRMFDGKMLPDSTAGVIAIMRNYLSEQSVKLLKVEEVMAHHSKCLDKLAKCNTVDELHKVRW